MIRIRTRTRLAAVSVAAALVFAACGDDADDSAPAATEPPATEAPMTTDEMGEMGTIVDVAVGAGSFNTLVAAVTAADLVETLSGPGPFTVFAPTDDAFAALPEGLLDALLLPENQAVLQQILTYHVVAGEVPASAVTAGDVATVQGENVTLATDGGVTINGANVVTTDVMASNGIIHVIDAVLVPPSIDPATLLP